MSHRTLFLIAAVVAGGILIGTLAAPFVSPVPKDSPGRVPESTSSPRIRDVPSPVIGIESEPDFMAALPDNFDPLADSNFQTWQYPKPSYEPWEPQDPFPSSEIAEVPAEATDSLPEEPDLPAEQVRKSDLMRNGLY